MENRIKLSARIILVILLLFFLSPMKASMTVHITIKSIEGVEILLSGIGGAGSEWNVIGISSSAEGHVTIPNNFDNGTYSGSINCIRSCGSCPSITGISIPKSVTSIYNYAFSECTSLESISVESGNTVYDSRDNCNAVIETASNKLLIGCMKTVIPASVTTIDEYAFQNCINLTHITIPKSVESVSPTAFKSCNKLMSIVVEGENSFYDSRDNCNAIIRTESNKLIIGCKNTIIPTSVTAIGEYAFNNYDGLTGILIPKSVAAIASNAFENCTNLVSVVSKIKVPFDIPANAFNNINADATLYVPYATLSLYKELEGWKRFKNIIESEEMDDGDLFNANTKEGVSMTFKVLDIANRTCQVGDNVQPAVTNLEINDITIPETAKDLKVVAVGKAAFSGCSWLKRISFPSTVTTVSNEALKGCGRIAAIHWNAETALPSSSIESAISNPNLLLYVKNKDYAPAGIQNVVVNGVAEKILLKEAANGNDFYCPEEFTAQNIEFTHNYSMTSGYQTNQGWETIALPFDVTNITYDTTTELVPIKTWEVGSLKRPFWLYEQTANGWQASTVIKGNIPYIICMPNNAERYDNIYNIKGDVTFKGENVKVLASDNVTSTIYNNRRFVPNFQNQNASNSIFALNVNNQWDSYTSTAHLYGSTFFPNLRAVHPFEAYMMTSDGNARAFIPIFEDGIPTGITDIMLKANTTNDIWYSLDGCKLLSKPITKGVYILNGKKVVIK